MPFSFTNLVGPFNTISGTSRAESSDRSKPHPFPPRPKCQVELCLPLSLALSSSTTLPFVITSFLSFSYEEYLSVLCTFIHTVNTSSVRRSQNEIHPPGLLRTSVHLNCHIPAGLPPLGHPAALSVFRSPEYRGTPVALLPHTPNGGNAYLTIIRICKMAKYYLISDPSINCIAIV